MGNAAFEGEGVREGVLARGVMGGGSRSKSVEVGTNRVGSGAQAATAAGSKELIGRTLFLPRSNKSGEDWANFQEGRENTEFSKFVHRPSTPSPFMCSWERARWAGEGGGGGGNGQEPGEQAQRVSRSLRPKFALQVMGT